MSSGHHSGKHSHHHASPKAELEPMPHGIHNVYIFEVFNTMSWCIVLGAPMLLFYQHLGATATILAIAACLAPILNILQIPAAKFVELVGYRRFVLTGWATRSLFVIGMAFVAFLPDSVDRATRMIAMLFLSFLYNVLRGISSCGMLPWFTHIVPESRRGEFLAKDQLASSLAVIGALFISAMLFRVHDAWYSFGIVFVISAVSAFVSLLFLRRIPDVPVEKIVRNKTRIPWTKMLFHPPFFKYVRYNIIINMAQGASGVFWVRYFRNFLHVSDSNTLYVACTGMAVIALCLFMVGPLIDRAGNKPALTLSGICLALHYSGWALVAAGILPFNMLVLGIQIFTSSLGGALWNLANVRTVMGIVPQMGRAHFLALYSVTSNLTLGILPLIWGPVMDYLDHWHAAWGFWHWNNYSLFYCALALTIITGLISLQAVAEPKLMTWDVFMRELLVKTPSRAVSRLISRWRGSGLG